MKVKTITVFGSSMPKPGDKDYEDAYLIGKKLGEKGFNICSGGFQGIMDAVSKGAKEAGAEAIGITVPLFKSKSSKYLNHEIQCDTLFERLDNLITYGDGFIILPGGTGTLLEISLVWEMINKNLSDVKPVVCLGEMWSKIVAPMEERVKLEGRRENIINCFNTVDEVVNFITSQLK
jgi:uncharacterized protein (TIGR00730 family)